MMIKMERLIRGGSPGPWDDNNAWKTPDYEPHSFRLLLDFRIPLDKCAELEKKFLTDVDGLWNVSVHRYAIRFNVVYWITDIFEVASRTRLVLEKFVKNLKKNTKKKKKQCKKNASTTKNTKVKGNRAANA